MLSIIRSKNGVPIRLTDERWAHVSEEHNELAGLRLEVLENIFQPDRIVAGGHGEILAVRELEPSRWLVVVYRESEDDGFIITAFLTSRIHSLDRRKQLWP